MLDFHFNPFSLVLNSLTFYLNSLIFRAKHSALSGQVSWERKFEHLFQDLKVKREHPKLRGVLFQKTSTY
jgi:hypothetical protein